jgi:hypothetical protein
MKLHSTPGTSKRLRSTASTFFQRTFRTPLSRLPAFVAILLAGDPPLSGGSVTIQQVVFTPEHLLDLLSSHNLPVEYGSGWTITAAGLQESEALLTATLADWVDFYFVPEPKRYLLYADHDEYTTLFAARRGTLSRLGTALTAEGFGEVADYVRVL